MEKEYVMYQRVNKKYASPKVEGKNKQLAVIQIDLENTIIFNLSTGHILHILLAKQGNHL